MNLVNIVLVIIIASILVAIIVHMVLNHKKGNDCSCGCERCKQNCGMKKK